MRKLQKQHRGKAARGGLVHFTTRRFRDVPVSDAMCCQSIASLTALVAALQLGMPLPHGSPLLAVPYLMVATYGIVVFYVKALWRQRVAV